MSMHTALSGLTAAQTDIAATSHNIANVGTVGFRGSRTEFADIFNQSPLAVSRTTTGSGVQVTRVAQDFTQGSIVGTGNRLDLAIEGPGFFALQAGEATKEAAPQTLFTRAGAFSLSADGAITNASGHRLLAWPVSTDGKPLTTAPSAVQPMIVPLSIGEPMATSNVSLDVALPTDSGQSAVPPAAGFDPADRTTWAHRTAIPMMTDEGVAVEAEVYLVRQSDPSATSDQTVYSVHVLRDGVEWAPDAGNTLVLDANGLPTGTSAHVFSGAQGSLTLDLGASVLTADPFEVRAVRHDGSAKTQLTTLDIDGQGTVWATYGSGQQIAQGALMLANFTNPGGLRVAGGATFAATPDSGAAIAGSPGSAGFGLLRSGSLERANVDLTEELVNLITSQRNYQASAKAMETSSTMMQTIMNIRG